MITSGRWNLPHDGLSDCDRQETPKIEVAGRTPLGSDLSMHPPRRFHTAKTQCGHGRFDLIRYLRVCPEDTMRRRDIIKASAGVTATVVWPISAHAQQRAVSFIGLLTATNLNFDQLKSIQKGLNEGGYFEGHNLAIIHRSADGQYNRLSALAADLVQSKVSVIFAVGGPIPARTAKAATTAIPIVFRSAITSLPVSIALAAMSPA
jgi:hypothetical protein